MSINTIASRYAKSLLDLAIEQKNLDKVVEDIKGFSEVIKNRDVSLLLKSPIVNTEKKIDVFRALFSKDMDKLTMSFIEIITKKSRERYLPEIAKTFLKFYQDYTKTSKVVITTASQMSEDEMNKIKSKLAESHITLDNLEIEVKIDESIIGGFIIEVGDNLYDASVAYKLEQLKKEFSGTEIATT
jgi:F-type H+-transporting ATPase subunit delta